MKRYVKNKNIVYVNICGEHLLVRTEAEDDGKSRAAVINESAAAIWQSINEPVTFHELNIAAAEYYGTDVRNSFLQTISFIKKMTESGFLAILDEELPAEEGAK